MSEIARVCTNLGMVRLHRVKGRYETRRDYRNADTGEPLCCVIQAPVWHAQWWHDLARERGVVLGRRPR